jgi:hypothetical protein
VKVDIPVRDGAVLPVNAVRIDDTWCVIASLEGVRESSLTMTANGLSAARFAASKAAVARAAVECKPPVVVLLGEPSVVHKWASDKVKIQIRRWAKRIGRSLGLVPMGRHGFRQWVKPEAGR